MLGKDGQVKNKICQNCGSKFVANAKHQRYCCEKCRYEYGRSHPKTKGELRKVVCAYCGKEFTTTNPTKKFCTIYCNKKYNSGAAIHLQTKNNDFYERGMIKKRKCHDCGKPTFNYRCDKCLAKWRRKHCVNINVGDSRLEEMI